MAKLGPEPSMVLSGREGDVAWADCSAAARWNGRWHRSRPSTAKTRWRRCNSPQGSAMSETAKYDAELAILDVKLADIRVKQAGSALERAAKKPQP